MIGMMSSGVPPRPEMINRPARQHEEKSLETLARLRGYVAANHNHASGDEEPRYDGPRAIGRLIIWPPAQAEHRDRHEREEKPFGVDHAREQIAIRSRGGQHARPRGLQHDGDVRCMEPRMDFPRGGKK